MIKSKRKLNKHALINKRLYTVVGEANGCFGNEVAGNIGHHYPKGTVVQRNDATYDRSDDSYVFGAVNERDRVEYADEQWLNVAQVI